MLIQFYRVFISFWIIKVRVFLKFPPEILPVFAGFTPMVYHIVLKSAHAIANRSTCFILIGLLKTAAIDTPGGKRNLKMKIKAHQMTFRQDITKI